MWMMLLENPGWNINCYGWEDILREATKRNEKCQIATNFLSPVLMGLLGLGSSHEFHSQVARSCSFGFN
ncbi:hypothetical protein ACHAXS_002408 [Conticribra weissflogii]